jgi:deoxyribodipyrimidine photo-lyase
MNQAINVFWFRRDLRLTDNAGLYHALKSGLPVLPIFIFDREILDKLDDKADKRVEFIHNALQHLQTQLEGMGSSLKVYYGNPQDIWAEIIKQFAVKKVFTNHDYEPYALERDEIIGKLLKQNSVEFNTYKDQVIFEKDEVLKPDGKPYTVFTPYSKVWKAKLNEFYVKPYPTERYFAKFYKTPAFNLISLEEIGFKSTETQFPTTVVSEELIKNYANTRDFPAIHGTSRLSLHFRFGTVSIRERAVTAKDLSEKYFNELIWREFYMSILWHFPYAVNGAFRPEYNKIQWENNETYFKRWCEGKTGYPLVDAGMRELNATGYMHNRVRMVVASFLTKHLLIDWRWGEAYFAQKLLDFELASNNGGWQWAAGCGVDAAPYFRVFNPELQLQKFDPQYIYVRRWVPEFGTPLYPRPVVDHRTARERCLQVYQQALKGL